VRRLLWARETRRPAPAFRLWPYLRPLGLLALAGLGLAAGAYLAENRRLPEIAIALLALGSVLPLLLTLRWPVLAWRLAFLMLFVGTVNVGPKEPWPWNAVQILGFLLVLGRLATTQPAAVTAWATGLSLVPLFVYAPRTNAWGAAFLLVAIAALGDLTSRRRRTQEMLAEQEELTELERAKRAVLEERAQIAREMHDVVAHHMSMIAVRAETAPYRLTDLPESAREELAGIATAARDALADMRRLLGVLRAEDGAAPTAPQPGLADLDGLVATARTAGVDVTLTADGLAAVPETVGLTAYRILQEALTNAARHGTGSVRLAIDVGERELRITVVNPTPVTAPKPPSVDGHGTTGMRERAALLGGTLDARRVGDRFEVRAALPYHRVP